MKPSKKFPRFSQTGFSLVEIMVGLVIGLLATLVVLQVFSVFEGQKRTTTGTAEAQTNGNVALFLIKRDLGTAGYGLLPVGVASVPDSGIECAAPNYDTPNTGITSLSPITITDGGTGAGASDIITIRYSTSENGGSLTQVADIGTAGATIATVNDNQSCAVGDIALDINSAGTCSLTTVDGLSVPPDYTKISLANPAAMGNAKGDWLACLGKWKEIEYSVNPAYIINPGNTQAYLQRKDTTFPVPAGGNPAAEPTVVDIVNIQAQYGITAAPSSNQIILWVDAKDGLASGNWGPGITVADRNRIKAVRIAVVARNGLLEKTNVTEACSSLTSDSPSGLCAWSGSSAGTNPASDAPAINLSNDPDWQRYRYRVFETIIPLRNVIWSKNTL